MPNARPKLIPSIIRIERTVHQIHPSKRHKYDIRNSLRAASIFPSSTSFCV